MTRRYLSYTALAWAFAVVIAVLVAGCAPTVTGGRGGAWCEIETPLVLAESTIAAMTRSEFETALAHNEYEASACGWGPRKTTK